MSYQDFARDSLKHTFINELEGMVENANSPVLEHFLDLPEAFQDKILNMMILMDEVFPQNPFLEYTGDGIDASYDVNLNRFETTAEKMLTQLPEINYGDVVKVQAMARDMLAQDVPSKFIAQVAIPQLTKDVDFPIDQLTAAVEKIKTMPANTERDEAFINAAFMQIAEHTVLHAEPPENDMLPAGTRFKHDEPSHVFIGQQDKYDVWHGEKFDEVILRFGDEPQENRALPIREAMDLTGDFKAAVDAIENQRRQAPRPK